MIQRLAANRRERQPRSKKEKMLDLLGRDRAGHPTHREELPPETVERVKSGKRPAGNGAESESSDGSW